MGYRNIVVHLDHSPQVRQRLNVAVAVAERTGAHLQAVFAVANANLKVLSSRQRLALAAPAAADLEQEFHEVTGLKAVASDWQMRLSDGDDEVGLEVIRLARFSDLIILGQFDAGAADGSVPADLVDRVILRSGTPVLIVPYSGRFPTVGERILIAWNGSREATRAMRDAVPLLAAALSVTVLALAPAGGESRGGDGEAGDLIAYLNRHGVNAEADRLVFDPSAINPAERLLSHLADCGTDLLVIGGPGLMAGPAQAKRSLTRQVMAQMTVPMLVSY